MIVLKKYQFKSCNMVCLLCSRQDPESRLLAGVPRVSPITTLNTYSLLTNFKSSSDIALILGALTAGGGITGYVRTGSIPSIAAGLTVGALVCDPLLDIPLHLTDCLLQYTVGGLRIRSRSPYGVELALLASIVLAGSSVPRAIKSGKPLPIGLSVLATLGLYTFGMAFQNRRAA